MTKPKLRFKEFNDDWLTTTIGKVSQGNLSYGMNAAAKDFDGTNKYIRITDIDEFSNKYLYDNVVSPAGKLDNNFLLKNNDIIFARTGASTGKTYLYNLEDGILYYAGFLIKAHIKDDICAKFIFYCTKLDKYKKWVSTTSLRSGQPGINAQEYSNYKFKIPTLLEQEKIAGFLSKVDELINECEGEVKDIEEQKKGLMQKIFSQQIRFKDSNNNPYPDWEEEKIKNVTSYVDYRGKTPPKTQKGIFLITAKNIKKGFIDYNCSKEYVAEKNYAKIMSRGCPQIGDVLITTEAPCGNVAQIDIVPVALAQRVIKLRGISNIMSNNFLKYLLLSDNFQLLLLSKSTGGTVKGIKGSVFHELPIKFPCLEEQEKIAKVLSKMDELIEEKKALLSDWQRFKKGLLQQMFV